MNEQHQPMIDLTDCGKVTIHELINIIKKNMADIALNEKDSVRLHMHVFSGAVQLACDELASIMIRTSVSQELYHVPFDAKLMNMLAEDMKKQVEEFVNNFNKKMIGVTNKQELVERILSLEEGFNYRENLH